MMHVRIIVGAVQLQIIPVDMPVESFVLSSIFKELREELTYTVPNYRYMTAYKLYNWDGKKTLITKKLISNSGCYQRIIKFLESKNVQCEIEFEHNYQPLGRFEIHGLTLDQFQEDAAQRVVEARYGIISAPVRTGKTAIISSILNRLRHYPAVVVTNGKDLVIQTRQALEEHLLQKVGVFSESEFAPENITVMSYQALYRIFPSKKKKDEPEKEMSTSLLERNEKVQDLIKHTRVLILDECHHAFSPKSSNFLDNFVSVGYKIGLSGTPKADLTPRLAMEGSIGPIVFNVRFGTLIKSGRIAQPVVIAYNLPYAWYAGHLSEYQELYEINIVQNVHRNQFIAEIVANLQKQGKTAFVLVRKIEHGVLLRDLIPNSVFVRGSVDSSLRKELYEHLQSKELFCIIATVGKEGLNLPTLNAVINAEGLVGHVVTQQKMRSLTACEGKELGLVIDFLDKGKYLKDHSESRIKQYKKFGGFIIKEKIVHPKRNGNA